MQLLQAVGQKWLHGDFGYGYGYGGCYCCKACCFHSYINKGCVRSFYKQDNKMWKNMQGPLYETDNLFAEIKNNNYQILVFVTVHLMYF